MCESVCFINIRGAREAGMADRLWVSDLYITDLFIFCGEKGLKLPDTGPVDWYL